MSDNNEQAAAPAAANENKPKQQQQQQQKKNNNNNNNNNNKKKKNKKQQVQASPSVPEPEFISERIAIFDELFAKQQEEVRKRAEEQKPIKVTLPDGRVIDGVAFESSPFLIAKAANIPSSVTNKAVVAKVNDQVWDLTRPLEEDATLELLMFDSEEGKHTFWHSSAHVLGQSLEKHFGAHLCIGPAIEGGFYYDAALDDDRRVTETDLPALKKVVQGIVKQKQPFQRLVASKEDALRMFQYNKYKSEIISSKVPDGENCTVYRCGPLIDLCRGPHVPNTGRIKTLEVTKNSAAYWLGKKENDALQRVYGVSFPEPKLMKEWQEFQRQAALRDHRRIGREQNLFFFNELSPGSCFWLPRGMRLFNRLMTFIRKEYRIRGYDEVLTPNIFEKTLYETSGHWQNYQENLFIFECEKQQYALKPMNCPGHCLLFKSIARSHKELPLRFAEFGVLHRNEFSGALTGLTRVRRFQQDDAHIFCTHEQVKSEISQTFDFMRRVYGVFDMEFTLELSTRPEKYLGEIEVWNKAEKDLEEVLNESGLNWKLNPGDGAFYGPKIDVHVRDALGREFQCATVQLDFQLPIRFDLKYVTHEQTHERPVIVHRAIYGSLERFLAIITEHFAGKWPLWLSPRQVIVLPIIPQFTEYAKKIQAALFEAGHDCEIDTSERKLQKMVREAQLAQFNYILVIGRQEEESGAVNVRTRDTADQVSMSLEEFVKKVSDEVAAYK